MDIYKTFPSSHYALLVLLIRMLDLALFLCVLVHKNEPMQAIFNRTRHKAKTR